jgi:hypothetical protein
MQKYEHLSDVEIIERYKKLKDSERLRNKICYQNMKDNYPEKYNERLMKNKKYINNYLEDIKSDSDKLELFKQQRKYTNSLYYYRKQC